ncbi:YdeI/OmpD-associated family protein [Reinekea blandensis]|nr:YdeI/OmpD-associated family protein [Reinekea blandensis]
MKTPTPDETQSFASTSELQQWFQNNHFQTTELWVKIYKKASGIDSVTWDDLVEECLCWGWIDGLKKSLDDVSYLQRVTPRKPKSLWSKRNRHLVEAMIANGRMQDAGLSEVIAAKADGRWEQAYRVSENTVPDDFLAALAKRPEAKRTFDRMTKSGRLVIAHGLGNAKREDTRARRFAKYIDLLNRGEKPDRV